MGIHELILQKLHGKTINVLSLQNYILYIDSANLCQYRIWLPVIVCVLILTWVDKITMINHIISMKNEKIYLRLNIDALIKWWIPFDLLQLWCRWIEDIVTCNYRNESYCFNVVSTEEKQIPLLLL
jgi:hypothetical protein